MRVGRRNPGTARDGEVVAGIKWLWLFAAVYQGSQDVRRHASETLADEAVQEEVDAGVE